jgi:hypothetical protein
VYRCPLNNIPSDNGIVISSTDTVDGTEAEVGFRSIVDDVVVIDKEDNDDDVVGLVVGIVLVL